MDVRRRGDNDGVQFGQRKQLFDRGAGVPGAKVARDFFRLGAFATLHRHQFRPGV